MENLKSLSAIEILEISGGHDGIAYQIGHAIGKALVIVSVIGFFFVPKS